VDHIWGGFGGFLVVSTALRRRWTWCSTQPEPPGVDGGFEFSVMTYNILSQELLRDNAYLYRHCHPAHLPWEYRLPNLLTEIQQHAADILCLQEFFRGGDALLDRDNVGLILLLQPTGTGDPPGDPPGDPSSCVCVANTHLLYNPHRGDVKLAQLAILLAEIGRVSRLPDGSSRPVLLCGDLNSSPQSPLYSFLTRGRLEYKGLRIGMRRLQSPIWSPKLGISRRCRYESKRPKFTPAGPPPAVSDPTLELEEVNSLPNQHHSSDHLPLLVRFRLRP
ncbi:unnamed protein product, partial [Menidia menidia]